MYIPACVHFIISGLNIVEQSLWKAVPHYLRRVSNALKKVCLQTVFGTYWILCQRILSSL
jgi:phosphoenolpyruvate carboxylase